MPLFNPPPFTHPGFVAGRWYNPNGDVSTAAGTAPGTGVVRMLPFMLVQPITVSDLGVCITTLAAGGNVRAAIYASDPTTKVPTGVAVAETGNIVTDAAVAISADITGANVSLAPGLYWQAVIADNATVVLKAPTADFTLSTYLYGSTTLATAIGTATGNRLSLSFTSAFGAFPDLTGQSLTESLVHYGIIFLKAV